MRPSAGFALPSESARPRTLPAAAECEKRTIYHKRAKDAAAVAEADAAGAEEPSLSQEEPVDASFSPGQYVTRN